MDWFLCDNGLHHERVNINSVRNKFTDLQTITNGNVIIVSIAEIRLDASFQSLIKRQTSGTSSVNEGQRMTTSGTTSDNK